MTSQNMRNRLTHLSVENSPKSDSDDVDDRDKSEWQLLQLKNYGIKIYLKIKSNEIKIIYGPRLWNKSSKTKKQYAQRHVLKLHEQHTTDTQGLARDFFARGMYLVGGGVANFFLGPPGVSKLLTTPWGVRVCI